jgi:hypothetical protein
VHVKTFLAVATPTLIALLAALACNGGGGPSLDEYFADLQRAISEGDAQVDELPTPDLTGSFETARDDAAQYYDDYATRTEDIIHALDGIEPPDAAATPHDRFVEALRALPSATYIYADRIRDAVTEAEFQAAYADTAEGEAIVAEVAAACDALQSLADENEITVDLRCDG